MLCSRSASFTRIHEDDAQIGAHREHHLAEVLGLELLVAPELELADLRDALDEAHDGGPHLGFHLLPGEGIVLERVVQ
jgi:hypothetical protein